MQRSDYFLKSFLFSLKYYLYLEQNQKYVVDVLYILHIHNPKKIPIFNFHLRQKMYLQNFCCVEGLEELNQIKELLLCMQNTSISLKYLRSYSQSQPFRVDFHDHTLSDFILSVPKCTCLVTGPTSKLKKHESWLIHK